MLIHPLCNWCTILGASPGTVAHIQMCDVHFYVTGVLFLLHSSPYPYYILYILVFGRTLSCWQVPVPLSTLFTFHVPWTRHILTSLIGQQLLLFNISAHWSYVVAASTTMSLQAKLSRKMENARKRNAKNVLMPSPEKDQCLSCGRYVVAGPMGLSRHLSSHPQCSLEYSGDPSLLDGGMMNEAQRTGEHRPEVSTLTDVVRCSISPIIVHLIFTGWQRFKSTTTSDMSKRTTPTFPYAAFSLPLFKAQRAIVTGWQRRKSNEAIELVDMTISMQIPLLPNQV